MKTSFSLILAAAAAALLTSCYVVPDKPAGKPTRAQLEQQKKEAEDLAKKEAEEKKKQELEAQKKKKEAEALANESNDGDKKRETVTKPPTDELPTPRPLPPDTKPTYPVAKKAPGKEGFVLSPYNQKLVDVRGIASGKLVRDPTYDPSEKKFFRVP
jgi:membrane-bound lytic murein transglycosylase